jgi:hypothetical protein
MGLWTMVLPGLMPVTALISGAVTQYVGAREGYGIAGVLLAAAALAGWRALSSPPSFEGFATEPSDTSAAAG